MSYDEQLAGRIRALAAGEPGLTEKKMFGGLAFLAGGNMASAATAPARHAPRESGLTCILDGLTKLIAERTPSTETDGQTTPCRACLGRVARAVPRGRADRWPVLSCGMPLWPGSGAVVHDAVVAAAGAGAAGAGAVPGEHLWGGPAVQLHQVPFGSATVEPGMAEVVPEPVRVGGHAALAAPAGDDLVDPGGSERPAAARAYP